MSELLNLLYDALGRSEVTPELRRVYDETDGDPDNGIAPGTKWDDVPDSFVCPLCGVGKDQFEPEA